MRLRLSILCLGIVLISCLVVFGCVETDDVYREPLWSDIDLLLYQRELSLGNKALGWDDLAPANETDYWELRLLSNHFVEIKAGDKCKNATNRESCIMGFDAIRTDIGFGGSACHPLLCPHYIVSNQKEDNQLWSTLGRLKEFLGKINSSKKAVLLASGYGFQVECSISSHPSCYPGGIREIDGEYELIVAKTISLCHPYQSNRYLIRIKPSGELVILREQINHRNDKTSCS